ncbi:radical SAM protein [bacterium]|nr:radical SAM protein [bacterium]MCI0605078.1 radical SAM protein [bacterium]
MKMLKEFFRIHLPEKPAYTAPGIYHYRREAGGNVTRFHLRVEQDGSGVLLANSSVAARLSSTGVLIAKSRLEGVPYPVISKNIKTTFYGATESQIELDVRKISRLIGELANLDDNYPIFNLDDPAVAPPKNLIAPFHAQMKVASPEQINPLLEKLWKSGIMHVTFNQSSANVSAAVANVERAEDLGMISGVRVHAGLLLQGDLFQKLAMAGVDYIVLPVVSANSEKQDLFFGESNSSHVIQCLEQCKKWEVTPVLEVPIFRQNLDELEQIVDEFSAKGVSNVLYYAIAAQHAGETPALQDGLDGTEIIHVAARVADIAHGSRVRYVWLPAVSGAGELKALLEKGPRTAGDVSIRVDPDGSVYAPRGPLDAAGNLSKESWAEIWNRDVFKQYRERIVSPTRCGICPELEICGADCPGDPKGWARS